MPEFDRLIGGGLRKGQVLEIAGPPGCGKTILALEFARASILEGRSVLIMGENYALGILYILTIIDCQNALNISRVRESLGSEADDLVSHVSLNGFSEFFSFLNQLPEYLSTESTVRLQPLYYAEISDDFRYLR